MSGTKNKIKVSSALCCAWLFFALIKNTFSFSVFRLFCPRCIAKDFRYLFFFCRSLFMDYILLLFRYANYVKLLATSIHFSTLIERTFFCLLLVRKWNLVIKTSFRDFFYLFRYRLLLWKEGTLILFCFYRCWLLVIPSSFYSLSICRLKASCILII